ncbi:MAG: RNA polymerase sigma factor [Solirubrobacteraceae bacterium]
MAASAWTTAPARTLDFLSDERLARLAARGDERAFGALFARHHAALTRYCRTVLRHAADAEDAAQNALVAAHRALQGGTVPLRVKPWLYKIAHNEAISLVRSRKPAEELDEATLPTVADPAEAGEIRRRLGQLMADLQALTERQREALVLRELCGLEYAEIATTLGSSEAAAQQTVFEARSALQQFGEGRDLDCEGVQRAMSQCDGMRLRTRTVRAHVRGCACCRSFETALRARRRDLGLLFPPTGAGGLLAALARILGGGGGEPLLAGLGLKGAAVGLALLAGGGAVAVTSADRGRPASRPTVAAQPAAAQAAVRTTERTGAALEAPALQQTGASMAARKTRRRHGGAGAATTPRPGSGEVAAAAPVTGDGVSGSGTHASTDAGTGGSDSRDTPSGGTGGSVTHLTAPARAPGSAGEAVAGVQDAVTDITTGATDAVQGVVDQVTDTASDTVGQVTTTAQDTVDDVADIVTGVLPKLP